MVRDVPAGTLIDDRYRVISRVGSGGMADVYCAEDLQLGRSIALKLLYRRFAEDQEFVERFRREASHAAGLQHPNVVSVYDRGEWDGTSYIAMEHIEGRTLKQLIQQEAPLDPARAAELATQVLRATRFAHKRGVIHRDLKPHNVMVDAEGRAKVTDFGIAKAGASEMTQTGSIMGTAQYLSPEQAQGLPVSAPSDLYSIGIILYEMLTARVPFDGDSAVTIALKQVNEQPVPPSALNPAVSPALDAVVLRALEKEPARRFADADEFIDALEQAGRDQSRSAVATGATAVAMAPVAATTVAGGGPPTGAYPAEAYAYPPAPLVVDPVEEDRRRWWVGALVALLVVALLVGGLLLLGGKQVTVPAVIGAPSSDAQLALRKAGLSVEVVPRQSDRPRDTVINQDPEAGTKVDDGSTVTLTVSSGPGNAPVPDVAGDGRVAATRALKKAGFQVVATEETSDTVAKDHVIRTSPAAGQTLERGSTVRLFISSGRERVQVPDVTGQAIEDARSTLDDAGFRVRTSEQENETKDPGTVLAQNPAGGTLRSKGATIVLTVAKAPTTIEVPDVVGSTGDEAATTLSAAGFTVITERAAVTSQDEDGIVLSQKPGGKQKAKKGDRVTITVGRFTATSTAPRSCASTPA
jgi:serine/threonine-protein kinase